MREAHTTGRNIIIIIYFLRAYDVLSFPTSKHSQIGEDALSLSLFFFSFSPFHLLFLLPPFIPLLRLFLSPSSFSFSRNTASLHSRKQRIRTSAGYAADIRGSCARVRRSPYVGLIEHLPLEFKLLQYVPFAIFRGTLPERRAPRARGLPL